MTSHSEGLPIADLWRWMAALEPERYQIAYRRLMRWVAGRKGDGKRHGDQLAAMIVPEGTDGR